MGVTSNTLNKLKILAANQKPTDSGWRIWSLSIKFILTNLSLLEVA